MEVFHQLEPQIGIAAACAALQINRVRIYRERARALTALPRAKPPPRPRAPLALSDLERQDLLQILDSERFVDVAPATIYATLLDEGRYHGSVRTMYRLLEQENQSGERRRQRVHPVYESPSCWQPEPTRCGAGVSPS